MIIKPYLIYICLFLFSGISHSAEFDLFKGCKDINIQNIPQLSLKKNQVKQYSALIKLLINEKAIPTDNIKILNNFHTCWSLAAESIDIKIPLSELTDSGLKLNDKTIKYGNSALLSRDISKLIRRLKIKPKSTKDLFWYCFTEALIVTTNNRFNYYVYAEDQRLYESISRGRRQQLGFIPNFENGTIIVDRILDSLLDDKGLKTGMLISDIRSDTLKVDKNSDWWFQERAFNYTMTASNGNQDLKIQAKSLVQIQDSIATTIEDDIAYMQIHYFNQRTNIDAWRFLRNLNDSVKGIILDVRGNSGGSMNLELVSFFLKPDQLVAVIDENDGYKRKINANVAYIDKPIVVLQDENSASMSELLSAMLQKQGRATIIGQPSFGKSAVQHVIEILNEGTMALVKQNLYYPDAETSWNNTGIEPDIILEVNEQQTSQLINSVSSIGLTYDLKEQLKTDYALRKAVTLLKKEKINED